MILNPRSSEERALSYQNEQRKIAQEKPPFIFGNKPTQYQKIY